MTKFIDYFFLLSGEASDQICEKIGKCNYNFMLNFDFALREVDENGEIKVNTISSII